MNGPIVARASLAALAASCAGPAGPGVPEAPPRDAPAGTHLAHARALSRAGYPRTALEAVDAALVGDPASREALRLKAALHEELGEERAAFALYERLVERAPGDLDALYRGGLARLRSGDAAGALPPLRRYCEVVPGDAAARHAHGVALYRSGLAGKADPASLDAAERELRAARDLEVENPEIHHDLACVLVARGDLPHAEAEYRFALQWNPEHAAALGGLAELLVKAGRREEARPVVERALAVEGDPRVRDRLEKLRGTPR